MIREHIPHSNKLQFVRDLFNIIGVSWETVSGINGDISFSDVEVSIVFYYLLLVKEFINFYTSITSLFFFDLLLE